METRSRHLVAGRAAPAEHRECLTEFFLQLFAHWMPEVCADLPVSRRHLCWAPRVYGYGDRMASRVEEKQEGHAPVDRSFRSLVVWSPHPSEHLSAPAEIGGPAVKAYLSVAKTPCHASCAHICAGCYNGARNLLREEFDVASYCHHAIRNDEIVAHDDGRLVCVGRADEDLIGVDLRKRLSHLRADRVQHLPRQVHEICTDHDRALLNFVPFKQFQHEHLCHHR